MIIYDSHQWRLRLVFRWKGSVIPKTFQWSIPGAIAAAALHINTHGKLDVEGVLTMWSSFTFVLGFCVVFHNNQAYNRFQEGSTLIHQVRGEWYNAISTIVSMTNHTEDSRSRVEAFNHLLVRLMSMLYCAALQQVAALEDDNFDIIDNSGLNPESLRWLSQNVGRCEIILQWIQRLVYEAHGSGIITAPPPLLSRAFQELSRGIVLLNNVKKIKEIPFPFPYVQVSAFMLLLHWVGMPIIASQTCQNWWTASVICFVVQSSFWSLHHIAQEIEQPFGEDANDLPLAEMQMDMNRSLAVLLDSRTQEVPKFRYNKRREGLLMTRVSDLDMLHSAVLGANEVRHKDTDVSTASDQGGHVQILTSGMDDDDDDDDDILPPRGISASSVVATGTGRKRASLHTYSDRLVSFLSSSSIQTPVQARSNAERDSGASHGRSSNSSYPKLSAKSWLSDSPRGSASQASTDWSERQSGSLMYSRKSFAERVESINQGYRDYYPQARLRAMVHQASRARSSPKRSSRPSSRTSKQSARMGLSLTDRSSKKSNATNRPSRPSSNLEHVATHSYPMYSDSKSNFFDGATPDLPDESTHIRSQGISQGGLRPSSTATRAGEKAVETGASLPVAEESMV